MASQIHPIWEEGRTRLDLWAKEASGSDMGALLVNLWQQRDDFLPLLNTHVRKEHLGYFDLLINFITQSGQVKRRKKIT